MLRVEAFGRTLVAEQGRIEAMPPMFVIWCVLDACVNA
jgi:hypothetical protein